MDSVNVSVKITAYLVTENRGDHWAVVNEQLGTTAYGETEEAALLRADKLLVPCPAIFDKYKKVYN